MGEAGEYPEHSRKPYYLNLKVKLSKAPEMSIAFSLGPYDLA